MGSVNKWENYGKWRHGKKRNELLNIPPPPKDRIFKESSWLETITFGLYKSKK
jgi:hypothetical protein